MSLTRPTSYADLDQYPEFKAVLQTSFDAVFRVDHRLGVFTQPEYVAGIPMKSQNPPIRDLELSKMFTHDPSQLSKGLPDLRPDGTLSLKPGVGSADKRITRLRRATQLFVNGDFGIHPDQLLAPGFMPDGLFRNPAALYNVALRLLDLQDLKERGHLTMEPVDFLRWRIGSHLLIRPNAFYSICQLIHKVDEAYSDPIMRFVMQHVDDVAKNCEATKRALRASGSVNYKVTKQRSKLCKLLKLRVANATPPSPTSPEAFRLQRAKDNEERKALRDNFNNVPIDTNVAKSGSIQLSPRESVQFAKRLSQEAPLKKRTGIKRLF